MATSAPKIRHPSFRYVRRAHTAARDLSFPRRIFPLWNHPHHHYALHLCHVVYTMWNCLGLCCVTLCRVVNCVGFRVRLCTVSDFLLGGALCHILSCAALCRSWYRVVHCVALCQVVHCVGLCVGRRTMSELVSGGALCAAHSWIHGL